MNATYRPSPEMELSTEWSFASPPSDATLTRIVVPN
jgi:hypothetical protein